MDLPGAAPPRQRATTGPLPGGAPADHDAPRVQALREALTDDPYTEASSDRHLLRSAVADVVTGLPSAQQLADLDALLLLTAPRSDIDGGLGLSEREWVEVTCAVDRLASLLDAMRLTAVAALDHRVLSTRPAAGLRRDSRRPTADALAPALKIALGSGSALVGLSRRSAEMPLALDALADGAMTPAQFRVLDTVLRRIPDPGARAQVEATAVRKAATAVRAQLAGILQEAAVQADPGYVARTTALGIQDRDARLVRSPVPGCQRVIIDLARADAAMFWQVLNQAATQAKDHPVADPVTGTVGEEERSLPQLRADFLVSLVVGMFSPTAAQAAAAQDPADEHDEHDEHDEQPDPDLPADTRALVRIPTPAERSKLAELHVVVLADDLDDDPGDDDPGDDDPGDDDPGDDDPGDDDLGGDESGDSSPGDRGPGGAASAPRRPRRRGLSRALAGFRPMGHLPGYGRLDPETTAAVIERAPWRRMVADPVTGVLVQRSTWVIEAEVPRSGEPVTRRQRLALLLDLPAQPPPRVEVSYRPSSGLAAFIRARDATCIGPACHHAARSGGMQLDHTVAWGPDTPARLRGGATAHGNLGCVCVRVHNAKTHGGWVLQQPRSGSFRWRSPAGLVYLRQVTPLVPDLLGDLAA